MARILEFSYTGVRIVAPGGIGFEIVHKYFLSGTHGLFLAMVKHFLVGKGNGSSQVIYFIRIKLGSVVHSDRSYALAFGLR